MICSVNGSGPGVENPPAATLSIPTEATNTPMRAAIPQAAGALKLPPKKRRTAPTKALSPPTFPRGRLCTLPAALRLFAKAADFNEPCSLVMEQAFDSPDTPMTVCSKAHLDADMDWDCPLDGFEDGPSWTGTSVDVSNTDDVFGMGVDTDVFDHESLVFPERPERTVIKDHGALHEDDDFATDTTMFDAMMVDDQGTSNIAIAASENEAIATKRRSQLGKDKAERGTPLRPLVNAVPVVDLTMSSTEISSTNTSHPKPFVRGTFPAPSPISSHLPNLASGPRILTCFRTADVLRAASLSNTSLIELYAMVTSSQRVQDKQYFLFSDLFFPTNPPHIQGCYIGWKGIDLFEDDTITFLKARLSRGVLCRAICAMIKKKENKSETSSPKADEAVSMRILNIWKATWDDIDYAKGLVL